MTLDAIVSKHVNEVIQAMKTRLTEELNTSLTALIVKAKDRALAKNLRAQVQVPMSDETMRCRFSENGHRCKDRSRGPRFRFLCAKHSGKTAKLKAPKAKVTKTAEPVETQA